MPIQPLRRRSLQGPAVLLAAAAALSGCVSYRPLPLADHPNAARQIASLQIDTQSMPLPELRAHPFDPSDGLDMTEVAMIAVANNPDLKLARDDLGIARAQAFSAGLLPDPQLSISSDFPAPAEPGMTRAFTYGLSWDVMSLLTRSANVKSAEAGTRKTELTLLWQEWQTVAQARQLFARAVTQDKLAVDMQRLVEVNRLRYMRTADAVRQGNSTADIESTVLATYRDIERQAAEAKRARNQTRHDLNALLGIAPDVHLDLVETASDVAPVDSAAIDASLRDLPQRRPDLLALQAGYREQEEKTRSAILAQFPSLTVGFQRSRDTSNVYTSGFTVGLTLPIFNRNRGNIAIEQATRQRLADEYQNRLNQAHADIDRMRADQTSFATQLEGNRATIARLSQMAANARVAWERHNLPLPAYVDAETALLTKQIETVNLEQTLLDERIAMNALLGGELPARLDTPISTDHHAE
ncbi:TPA: TolC family protein [Burkholderia cepacia ATCC 25416]|nr:TolC family protein [Burkholderia cepacia ATCC 25416]